MPIEAVVALKGENLSPMGRDRVRLLEAVAREGSISAGAKAAGLTYKAAWDALDAMTNLIGLPLLETRAGGRAGGGTRLTPAGLKVIESFRRLEGEMARVARDLEPELAEIGIAARNLVSGFLMKTSARNMLRGTISAIAKDALSAEVAVSVSESATIYALVTHASLVDLGLCVGREVLLLIKAPFVIVASGAERPTVSARNCLSGTVRRCECSGVGAEVVIEIDGGKTLVASITAASVEALGLAPGKQAHAVFDSAHVVIATD